MLHFSVAAVILLGLKPQCLKEIGMKRLIYLGRHGGHNIERVFSVPFGRSHYSLIFSLHSQ
jgi:hypothetical protein